MKNLDLWAGRLPIGRTIELLLVAALIALVACLLPTREAHADTGDADLARAAIINAANAKYDAIGDCMKHGKDGQSQTACVLSVALLDARGSAAPAPAPAPAPQYVAAPIKDCTGWAFIGCAISYTWTGVKELTRELQPFAGPAFNYATAIKQYEFQGVQAREATVQEQARQGTTQYAFGAIRDVALKPAPVAPPAPTPVPTTQINVEGNTGPVLIGSGSQDNKVNPAPVICFGGTVTAAGTCSR